MRLGLFHIVAFGFCGCLGEISDDLYEVLEVDEDADDATIKKAYRTLSVKYHPDKNPASKQRFNAIRDAYEILSDPEKRVLYDTGGMEILEEAKKGNVPETEDITMNVEFTAADAYAGVKKKVRIRRRIVCRNCRANKGKKKNCQGCTQCPSTHKMVHFRRGNMIYQQQQEVPSNEDCRMEHKDWEVQIDPGAFQGDQVVFKHQASQMPGHSPGNVIITLKQRQGGKFKRSGNDLSMPISITLREALLGWERTLTHLDGHKVHISTDEVTKPGQVIRIKGEGMPFKDTPSQFGDLDLQVTVSFPVRLTKQDKEEVGNIRALNRGDVRQEL